MQGMFIARSGVELVGGGEKFLFRDDWKKISIIQYILEGIGEVVLFFFLDMIRWSSWKYEVVVNGGGGFFRLFEIYAYVQVWGGVCYLEQEVFKVQMQKRDVVRKKGLLTRKVVREQ